MITFPPRSGAVKFFTARRGPFFFKKVKLTLDGFKFESFKEFKIHDSIKETNFALHRSSRHTAINDLFIVHSPINRETVTVIFRQNVEFSEKVCEIPELLDTPSYLSPEKFSNPSDFSFFKFIKLTNSKSVKLTFQSQVKKLLLNGDQLIILLSKHILIFSPLGTNIIEITANDIAVNRYLYILTKNQILIYGEDLMKTIDLGLKCDFIIPTTSHLFLIKFGTIYKLNGDQAEVYYECNAYIDSYCFDNTHLYVSNSKGVVKLGLFTYEVYSILLSLRSSSKISTHVSMNDDLVVFSSPGSGCVFIKKKDFSIINYRNLEIGLCGVHLYKNLIIYSMSSEERVFEYKLIGNDLYPVDIDEKSYNLENIQLKQYFSELNISLNQENDGTSNNQDNKPSKISNFLKNTNNVDGNSHNLSLGSDQDLFDFSDSSHQANDNSQIPNNQVNKKFKPNHTLDHRVPSKNDIRFKPTAINKVKDLLHLKDILFIKNPHFYYGSSFFNDCFSLFDKVLEFNDQMKIGIDNKFLTSFKVKKNVVDEFFNLVAEVTDHPTHILSNSALVPLISSQTSNINHSLSQFPVLSSNVSLCPDFKISECMPSPLMTQSDTFMTKSEGEYITGEDKQILQKNLDIDELVKNITHLEEQSLPIEEIENNLKSRFSKIRSFITKENLYSIEDSESSSFEGIIFETCEPQATNPIVQYLSKSFEYPKKAECQQDILAYDYFKKIDIRIGINNPITIDQKIDCLENPYLYSFIFTKKYCSFPKIPTFFIPNFFEFFENRFKSRNEKEIEYKYQIYEFINEEFKKIVGYKQPSSSIPISKPKTEFKKKKSGF